MKFLLAMLMTAVLVFGAACSGGGSSDDGGTSGDGNASGQTEDTGDSTDTKSEDTGSTNDETATENSEDTSDTSKEDSKKAKQGALMEWELALLPSLHTTSEPINALASLADTDDPKDFDKAAVQKAAKSAVEAASSFSDKVSDLTPPSKLSKDMQANLKTAKKKLIAYYQAKAEAAKKVKTATSLEDLKAKVKAMQEAGKTEWEAFVSNVSKVSKAVGLGEAKFSSEIS